MKEFLIGLLLMYLGCVGLQEPMMLIKLGIWEHTLWNWWGLISGFYVCFIGFGKIEGGY